MQRNWHIQTIPSHLYIYPSNVQINLQTSLNHTSNSETHPTKKFILQSVYIHLTYIVQISKSKALEWTDERFKCLSLSKFKQSLRCSSLDQYTLFLSCELVYCVCVFYSVFVSLFEFLNSTQCLKDVIDKKIMISGKIAFAWRQFMQP